MKNKLPVAVLSGYLGAGKTTLLQNILKNKSGLKVAVIVNDMSEINIDAQFIKHQHTLHETQEKLVEMTNGCICCTLREDLLIEVRKIAKENKFDYLLIENTGIGEPLPVAQTFTYVDEVTDIDLSRYAAIDAMITVVDGYNFLRDFGTSDTVFSRQLNSDETDVRPIVNLLTEQIEFADIIILNKMDLISKADGQLLKSLLKKLNPGAEILESTYGNLPIEQLIHRKLFSEDKSMKLEAWKKELEKEHVPETEYYGISSMLFKSRKPLHPERFWQFVNIDFPSNIIRSKGMFWLASRPEDALHWSHAGGSVRAEKLGVWWASIPPEHRMSYDGYKQNFVEIQKKWDRRFGDRCNEIVFIGQDLDVEAVKKSLESCLCSEIEILAMQSGKKFEDPFPVL